MNSKPMLEDNDLYRSLYLIRRFEETVLENFPRGLFFGTTHTYLGQEANAVGVISTLDPEDIIFSNHRCHGHFLAYGGDPHALFAELMGRATGVCGGRGGSQHLHWKNFYSNGIQGGSLPIATGAALAEKYKNSGAIIAAFLGDGTLGEGILYESLNLAALWRLPILFVLENNHIAQTTPIELALSGEIAARFQAFGIPACHLDTSDVLAIVPAARELVDKVRKERSPQAMIIDTCRFGPHSKGDDSRLPEEVEQMRQLRDPLKIMAVRLDPPVKAAIEQSIERQIENAFLQAQNDPFPTLSSAYPIKASHD